MKYHRDEASLDKATWMLAVDAVDALKECTELLKEDRHRIAYRLFRDTVESIDLLYVLHAKTPALKERLNVGIRTRQFLT